MIKWLKLGLCGLNKEFYYCDATRLADMDFYRALSQSVCNRFML